MHGVELNSVRGSEFCETLTGGFTRELPRGRTPTRMKPEGWNSQQGGTPSGGIPRGVELPEEWNSQSGGIPRGVELQGDGTRSRVEFPGRVKLGGIQPEWNPQE